MEFLSSQFLAVLAAVFALYWAIPRRRWQNLLLLAASLGFVLYFGKLALAVLVVSALLEWWIALRLGASESPAGR